MRSNIVTVKKLIFPLLLFLSGVGIILVSNRIKLTAAIEKSNIINARFYPRVVGAIILFVSIIEIIAAIKNVMSKDKEREFNKVEAETDKNVSSNNGRLIIFIVMLLIYQVLFFVTGFFPSTLLFLLASFKFLGSTSRIKLIFTSVVMTGVIYLLFSVVLNVPLPRGIF